MKPVLCAAAIAVLSAAAGAAERVTVRFGEQDTCKVTGVTTYRPDNEDPRRATACTIRFDLGRLAKDTKVLRAVLRMWVRPRGPFGVRRWEEKDFDGFKAWMIGGGEGPLATSYPFEQAHYGCQEWDVTAAARRWVAEPASNKGLRLNCPLAANDARPAWRRPYLQVTFEGDGGDWGGRPRAPTDLKAFCRHGQVFITWKQPAYDGAFFDGASRVYRHDKPITADNLADAALLGEVHRNSQLNYRRSCYAWDGLGAYGCFGVARDWLYAELPAGEKRSVPALQKHGVLKERYNFVIDESWLDGTPAGKVLASGTAMGEGRKIINGPELPDDAGLFVHTVGKGGKAWFAVASVIEGWENRRDVVCLPEPLAVKVARPRPVLQFVLHHNRPGGRPGEQYRQYVYWGGPEHGLHHAPSTPFMLQVQVPPRQLWKTPHAYPIVQYAGAGRSVKIRGDLQYAPPTPRAPFPSIRVSLNRDWGHWAPAWKFYHGSRRPPGSAEESGVQHVIDHKLDIAAGPLANFYGYHDRLNTGADPRGATARGFIENRILREFDAFFDLFDGYDRRLTRIHWQRPLMTLGMHHGDRIATVYSAMDTPWTSKRAARMWPFIGRKEWALKNPQGFTAWEWNDPAWFARKFPRRVWPFISTNQSPNYDRGDDFYNWQDMGYPQFYLDLQAAKRGGWFWWVNIGDAPDGGGSGGFSPLDEAFIAVANATCCQRPRKHWPDEAAGTVSGFIGWHSRWMPFARKADEREVAKYASKGGTGTPYRSRSGVVFGVVPLDLVDRPDRFEIALRIRDRGLSQNGNSVPPCPVNFGMADITPRRLQQFKVVPGKTYAWRNVQVATGRLMQAGAAEADANGLMTVPQVCLDRSVLGHKLIITPADGAGKPKIDTDSPLKLSIRAERKAPPETVELAYAEYLRRCRDPEMVKRIRPGRVFAIQDFLHGSKDGEFWSHWGADFADAFEFPQAGRYRVEATFRRALRYNGAWPVMLCSAAIPGRKALMLDSSGRRTYHWWIDAEKPGRKNVAFVMRNHTMNSPNVHYQEIDGTRTTRGFTVESVTFVPLGPRPAGGGKPWRPWIITRSVRTAPGLPTPLLAEVQDAWGEPVEAKLTWTASEGASVTADGTFTASRDGTYTVTASAVRKTDAVPVAVGGNAWVEDFDDEHHDGWRAVDLPGRKDAAPEWSCLRKKALGRMHQESGEARTALIWRAGRAWKDVEITADRVPGGRYTRIGPVNGLVFRFAGKDNFYLFTRTDLRPGKDEPDPKPVFRLVKVVDGKETELAREARDAPRIALTGKEARAYPSFKYWKDKYKDRVESFSFDRFSVRVVGDRIACSINGREVLTAADGDLTEGTFGLYCEGVSVFDNVRARPVKGE